MAEDESAVATVAAGPINMKPANIIVDWAPEEEPALDVEPVTPVPETTEPAPSDASPTESPDPAPTQDRTMLPSDLTKEEIDELVRKHPALKRRLDGELGSRLQQREAAIRKEAADAALAEHNQLVDLVNAGIDRYNEIEALQENNPEEYDAKWRENTQYRKWVADLFAKRDEVIARSKVKQAQAGNTASAPREAVLAEFHSLAIPEAIDTIRAEAGDMYQALPAETRRAIEGATYNPDSSWLQDVLAAFVKGTKAASEASIRKAVAAAREAARNEVLAEMNEDRPVAPNSPNQPGLTADQVIQEHAFNGFANITREQLQAAKKAKGLQY